MKRRDFIARLGGTAAAGALRPNTLRAQGATIRRIGILDTTAPGEYTDQHYWSAFRAQMAALGYVNGKTADSISAGRTTTSSGFRP